MPRLILANQFLKSPNNTFGPTTLVAVEFVPLEV